MSEEQAGNFTFALNTKVNDTGRPDEEGGQGEIYLHPDPIDLEIADFRFEFNRWVKNNTRLQEQPVNFDSAEEVTP